MTATTVEARRLNLVRTPDEGKAEADAIKERYGKGKMSGADELSDEEQRAGVKMSGADEVQQPDDIDKGVQAANTKLVQSTLTLSPPQVFPEGEKWQRSPAIAAAARDIAMSEAMAANGGKFAAFWREKGGSSKGRAVLGGVKLTSGMEKDVTGIDFYLWLAADHLANANEHEIRAQIYHQLAHIAANDETGGFGLVGHDFEGFSRQIELYGVTSRSLAKAKAVLEQAKLKLS